MIGASPIANAAGISCGLLLSGAPLAASGTLPPEVGPQSTLLASDAAVADIFGGAVAIDQATLVVGAQGLDDDRTNTGGAYVFTDASGDWSQVQKLTVATAAPGDAFGRAIAVDGVRMAMASDRADVDGVVDAGRVAIFTFNGASWVESASIADPGGTQAGAGFGASVAISGTALAIGAPTYDTAIRDEGRVTIHRFDPKSSTWALEAILVAPDAGENDRFGSCVALDGDRLVVGVPRDDDRGIDGGAAWVFDRSKGGWSATAKLLRAASDWQSGFGCAVAIRGEVVAIGADRDDTFGIDDGSVRVFERTKADAWLETAVLGAPGEPAARELGVAVAIAEDRVVAGMPVEDLRGSDVGAVATWTRSADASGGWEAESIVRPAAASELSLVGASVGVADARIVAGAPLWGGTSEPRGAALVLDLSADCDLDGRPDVVAIAAGEVEDCDLNTVPDACDIADGDAEDVDSNGIPDACFFDCDGNGEDDATEIESDPTLDVNGNGTLDACECLADLIPDGIVGGGDLGLFLVYAGQPCGAGTSNPTCIGDLSGNQLVDGEDLGLLLVAWGPCGP